VETPHYHSYPGTSTNTYGVSTASADVYVSTLTVSTTDTDLGYSDIRILPTGKGVCETDNGSSLPPYYKLGFIQANGKLVQDQSLNPIELEWYWWTIMGSAGTLAVVFSISIIRNQKKKRNREPPKNK
jgi:hypothetical protein